MNEHITRLEVKNFKKFDHLVVENIGRINLITGDNNVGKTSLLEVVLLPNNDYNKSIDYLHYSLCYRQVHIHPRRFKNTIPQFPREKDYFDYIKNKSKEPILVKWNNGNDTTTLLFEDIDINELTDEDFRFRKPDNYGVGNPNKWIKIFRNGNLVELQWMYLDDFKRGFQYGYWPYVTMSSSGFAGDINQFYKEQIGTEIDEIPIKHFTQASLFEERFKELNYEEKKKFISTLSLFIEGIEDATIKKYGERDILSIKVEKQADYQPVTFWGDGFNSFIRYLLEIVKNKDRFLLIDEFAAGVHWSKLKSVWVYVMKSCLLNNVQLFCTSHSEECITAFVEAASEIEDIRNYIRLIELEEAKYGKSNRNVYASTYDYEQIKAGLISNVNLRGGTL